MTHVTAAKVAASSPKSPRGGALDALRFFAALFVVVFHFGPEAPVPLQEIHSLFERGYLATDFFLMLSGFVLAQAYGRRVETHSISTGRFWLKRLARSYPTHIIALVGMIAMVLIGQMIGHYPKSPEAFRWDGLPAQVFLLHAFGIGGGAWNVPAWTLSALLVFYLLFPAMWRQIARLKRPAGILALGIGVLVVADLVSLAVLGLEVFALEYRWALFRAAPLFLAGLAIARFVQSASLSRLHAEGVLAAGTLTLAANLILEGRAIYSILAIGAVIIGCGALPPRRAIPGAQRGARVSFSLFMTHALCGAAWFGVAGPMIARLTPGADTMIGLWLVWLGGLVFAVAAAVLYDLVIDTPLQNRIQPWLAARPLRLRPARRPATAKNG